MTWIPRAEALKEADNRFPQLKITEKIFRNWTEQGRECPPIKQRGRIGFDSDLFSAWFGRVESSLVALDKDDYIKCFEFAVEAYYNPITKADFNRVKQRDVGEFLTNQIQGKLGEIAFQRLMQHQELEVDLDFRVVGQIPSQDITRISTRRNVWDNPSAKVSIKATKFKNVLLAIPINEVNLPDRRSDVYILSQVGLFPDHILRILKQGGEALVRSSVKYIPDFASIPARVGGWATHAIVTSTPALSGDDIEKEFGIRMASPNHVLRTGQLSVDWTELKKIIVHGGKK